MKPKFIMLVGISGAGKTTVAEIYVSFIKNTEIISYDAIRAELWGDESCQHNPKKVFEIMNERTIEKLKANINIIYDATNLIASRRKQLLQKVKPYCKKTLCIFIDKTVKECLKNQAKRKRQVPYDVIRKQYSQLEIPTYDEGWDEIITRYD